MKIGLCIPAFLAVTFVLAGCTASNMEEGPKKEVAAYSEELVEVSRPPEVYIEIDSGNLEVYSWDRKAVKFEITKRHRDAGYKNTVNNGFENFGAKVSFKDNKVVFEGTCKKGIQNVSDGGVDLKLFIPKKIVGMNCRVDKGSVKFIDDFKCDLKAELGMGSAEINYFEGNISFKADVGSLRIENGRMKDNSSVSINIGNIYIRSQIEEGGHCILKTKAGNIGIKLPPDSRVSFESIGTVEINEFPSDAYETRAELDSGIGRISIMKG